jgi:predicted RNase H-like HicB family nuclease
MGCSTQDVIMARYYPAIVEADRAGFSVFFPDVPGCTSGGATLREAARNAEEALQAHLDLSAEHGEPWPDPSTLDGAYVDPDVVVVSRLLVLAEVGTRPVLMVGGAEGHPALR